MVYVLYWDTPFDSSNIIGVVYHWGARLVIYWCQHQLPFVPIGIRWYRLRWYVNMNDAWTAPLMSWHYTMSMVHQHPHPVYHKAAVDQTRAYPTAVSIGTTARMIWEDRGLLMWRMKRGGEGSYRFYSSRCNIKICKKVDVTIITKRGRGRVRYWWISINEVLACCLGMCGVHRGPLAAMIVASSSRNWPW